MSRQYTEKPNCRLWSKSWCCADVADAQWKVVQSELPRWPEKPHVAFDAYQTLVERARPNSVLELGCGTGHYAEVTQKINPDIQYVGCDVSEPAIEIARRRFPYSQFVASDATEFLPADKFDVVMLGAIVGHVKDWQELLEHSWKLTRQFLLLHRVGVYSHGDETVESVKMAYGVKMAERFFREDAFLEAVGGTMVGEPVKWTHSDIGCMASYLVEK